MNSGTYPRRCRIIECNALQRHRMSSFIDDEKPAKTSVMAASHKARFEGARKA